MKLNEVLIEKWISMYKLSKDSGIPYMTLNDIINGKTNLSKCNAETVYRLAKILDVQMEELLEPYIITRVSFDLFRSNVCHQLKELGDINFLIRVIKSDDINKYYNMGWYPECLYLLAMVDYLSRINNVPLCDKYEQIRNMKLSKTVYPSSVIANYMVLKEEWIKKKARDESIPEFMRFNIVESDIRDVI